MEERLKLGAVLALSCGMLLGLLIGVSASSSRGGSGLAHTRPAALREAAPLAEHAAGAQADIHALRRQAMDLLLRTDSSDKVAETRKRWNEQRTLLGARLTALEASATRLEEKGLARALRLELAAYDAGVTKVLALIQDGTIKTPRDAQKTLSASLGNARS
jgi:hypothetical protein